MTCNCKKCGCKEKIYIWTAEKGEVKKHEMLHATPKGWRVKYECGWRECVVFKFKQYSCVEAAQEEKEFFQQRAFTCEAEAVKAANKQLISRESYHREILDKIQKLKERLPSQENEEHSDV